MAGTLVIAEGEIKPVMAGIKMCKDACMLPVTGVGVAYNLFQLLMEDVLGSNPQAEPVLRACSFSSS